jgi:hypothetical protein
MRANRHQLAKASRRASAPADTVDGWAHGFAAASGRSQLTAEERLLAVLYAHQRVAPPVPDRGDPAGR